MAVTSSHHFPRPERTASDQHSDQPKRCACTPTTLKALPQPEHPGSSQPPRVSVFTRHPLPFVASSEPSNELAWPPGYSGQYWWVSKTERINIDSLAVENLRAGEVACAVHYAVGVVLHSRVIRIVCGTRRSCQQSMSVGLHRTEKLLSCTSDELSANPRTHIHTHRTSLASELGGACSSQRALNRSGLCLGLSSWSSRSDGVVKKVVWNASCSAVAVCPPSVPCCARGPSEIVGTVLRELIPRQPLPFEIQTTPHMFGL